MSESKQVAFNIAILEGNLDVCRKSICDGLSIEAMTGDIKKSPIREVQLLLNFAAARRDDGFSDDEICRLIGNCAPDRLSKYDVVGVEGMKQVLRDREERVKRFRRHIF